MGFESDFVDETPVEFNIGERKFKYKRTTAREESLWLNDLKSVDSNGRAVIDWAMYNDKKLLNLTDVPYSKEEIKKVIGVEKEWSQLGDSQKIELLGKLSPTLQDKIIKQISKLDEPNEETVKN